MFFYLNTNLLIYLNTLKFRVNRDGLGKIGDFQPIKSPYLRNGERWAKVTIDQ